MTTPSTRHSSTTAPNTAPITVIAGVGPGLSHALAKKFAKEGHQLVLLSRHQTSRDTTMTALQKKGQAVVGYDCDVTDAKMVSATFAKIREEIGDPTTLIYNTGRYMIKGVLELEPQLFEDLWQTNCLGGFLCAREVLPAMVEKGAGTILLTGATASLKGSAKFAGFAVGKFGLRALAQSMAREFGPQGIHVAHIIIDGIINTPVVRENWPDKEEDTLLSPKAIAEQYWNLYQQDKTTWTQELDLRPWCENF